MLCKKYVNIVIVQNSMQAKYCNYNAKAKRVKILYKYYAKM